jgi:hypothetical protein
MSNEKLFKGKSVEVLSKSGGWSTIIVENGATRKVRNSDLKDPNAPVKMTKEEKAAARKALAAKVEVKKPAKAKREPKPVKPKDHPSLLNPDLTRYVIHSDVKTASGRKALDIDDEVAAELRGTDLSQAYRTASEATGETQKALKERYEHLNPGMQRMNLGNLVRGAKARQLREAMKAEKPAKKSKSK